MSSVARITEISAQSEKSFEDAISVGIDRAAATLRNLRSAYVKEQQVMLDASGSKRTYQVNLLITFVLE
jgi:flavin-binding protein dodecin